MPTPQSAAPLPIASLSAAPEATSSRSIDARPAEAQAVDARSEGREDQENLPSRVVHLDVVLDPAALTLTVEGKAPVLELGAEVIWRFYHLKGEQRLAGLPQDWTPDIFMLDGPAERRPGHPPLYTGPFSSLRAVPKGILGRGSSGLKGTYTYRALALNAAFGGGGVIASADQKLGTSVSERRVARQVTVTVDLLAKKFQVFPPNVSVYPAELVTWKFLDLPGGCRPMVRFSREGSSAKDFFFGPFKSLEVSENAVTGMGHNGATGHFGYSVLLVDANGSQLELLGSPDPHIDTEPDPF